MRCHLLFMLICATAISCREDEQPAPSVGGPTWMSHIAVAADSAFVMAPNVVTPNGDGLNDAFQVVARHVTTMRTSILFPDGGTAFASTSLHPVWSDLDSTDLGRYQVIITATSISGMVLSATSHLDVIDYGPSACLTVDGVPVTGDQFDPRLFGVTYDTQEVFCE